MIKRAKEIWKDLTEERPIILSKSCLGFCFEGFLEGSGAAFWALFLTIWVYNLFRKSE